MLMRRLSQSAPLVVVGQHATAWYDRLGRGSVASPLAHHSGCPVVVVPPTWRQGERDGRPVVVALDGEVDSLAALELAFDEAGRLSADLVALHVVPGGTATQTDPAERTVADLLASVRTDHPGTVSQFVTVRGDTQRAILFAAQSAALLVVGLPHTEGLAVWTRSLARRVMTSVECPMVVVPRRRRRLRSPAPAQPAPRSRPDHHGGIILRGHVDVDGSAVAAGLNGGGPR